MSATVQNMLKQFVNKYGSKFPILYSFLYYVVSFPTSEAVVESWGSSIDHPNKNKPRAKEVIGLDNTGTIDKLAFVRLNDPPLGFQPKVTTQKISCMKTTYLLRE